MQKNTKNIIAGMGIATVAGVMILSQTAFAAQPKIGRRDQDRTAIEKSIETKDYQTWKKLMDARGKNDITQIITEQNFAKFIQMHDLIQQKKYTEAEAMRKELGLPEKDSKMLGLKNNTQKTHPKGRVIGKKLMEEKAVKKATQN